MLRHFTAVALAVSVFLLTLPARATMQSIGKDQVNVRSGPSLKNSVIFRTPIGYPVEVTRQDGKWALVRDWEGDTGWVMKRFLSKIETAVVSVDIANVRSLPGVQHSVTAKAHRGEIYRILDKKGGWAKLGYYYSQGDEVGWIRQDLVFGD